MIREGLFPNVATFNTVMRALIEEGEVLKALKLVEVMQTNNKVVNPNRVTYSIVISALVANKRPQEAEILLSAMVSKGIKPDVELYTATITAYEKLNRPRLALKLMEKMSQAGYEFYDIPVLNNIFKRVVGLVNSISTIENEDISL